MSTVIYTRISKDVHDGAGVQRQEDECRALADREGWTVSRVFVDNDRSAYSGKTRPAFEELLAQVKDGRIERVLVWATDRFYRRLTDLERIIKALGDVPVYAVKSGEVDMSTADGRLHARLLGSVAQHSSEKTAERLRSMYDQRARAGRSVAGARPFGWARVEGGGLTPHATEAPALAEAYRRVLAGETISSIARWLDSEGFRGTTGAKMSASNLSAALRRPRNGGLTKHRGQVLDVPNADGRIVDEATWRAAQTVLSAPGRRTRGRNADTLLGGLGWCAKCGGSVTASSASAKNGKRYLTYSCQGRHTNWRRDVFDDVLNAEVEAVLVDAKDALAQAAAERADQGELLDEIEAAKTEIDTLAAMLGRGEITATIYAKGASEAEARLERAQAALVPSVVTDSPILGADDVVAAWRAASDAQKRQVLSVLIERVDIGSPRTREYAITWR